MERDKPRNEAGQFTRLPENMSKTTEARLAIEGITNLKERHIAFGDTQIPDVDYRALEAVLKVNDFYKATHVELMGDMLNCTTVGKFGFPADYKIDLQDEIMEGRAMLKTIADRVRKANPEVKIRYFEGNHEYRMQRYMDREAVRVALLREMDGEKTNSLPRLLGLKDLGIEWIPYWEDEKIGKATVLHGNVVRSKGGYTAQAYIDRYGTSGMSGHTHRLAMIGRTQSGEDKYWMETGSLCKKKMAVPYLREGQADWQQGFATVGIDKDNTFFPLVVPIVDGKASFGLQVFDGRVRK